MGLAVTLLYIEYSILAADSYQQLYRAEGVTFVVKTVMNVHCYAHAATEF